MYTGCRRRSLDRPGLPQVAAAIPDKGGNSPSHVLAALEAVAYSGKHGNHTIVFML
jgi:hypothetical protein